MARFIGNATGRTLAETIEKATGHLSDKEMPKAMVWPTRGVSSARRSSCTRSSRPSQVTIWRCVTGSGKQ